MTNKHEWVGTTGLKQLLLMLVGFIYLLWQWQVMRRDKGVQLPQQVTDESMLSWCSKREQERESGILSEWTRGVCLPGTSEDNIALHRCHRTHRRNIRLPRGNNYRQQRGNTINAMQQYDAWMWHGNMLSIELKQLATSARESIWTKGSNANSSLSI